MKKFLILIFSFLLIVGFSKPVQAFTLKDVMIEISSLKAEIAQLKSKLGAQVISSTDSVDSTGSTSVKTETTIVPIPTPTPAPAPVYVQPSPTPTSPINTDTQTQTEQYRANSGGYWIVDRFSNCVFVKVLPYGGVVCTPNQQREALNNPVMKSLVSKSLTLGMKEDLDVMYAQEKLVKMGYLNGKADGNYGQATKNAVMKLQRANGLTPDGNIGPKTLSILNAKEEIPKPVSVNSTTVEVDSFIKTLPGLISSYQNILNNPSAFKSEATRIAPKTQPQGGGQNLASQGYWRLWYYNTLDPNCNANYGQGPTLIAIPHSNPTPGACYIYVWDQGYGSN